MSYKTILKDITEKLENGGKLSYKLCVHFYGEFELTIRNLLFNEFNDIKVWVEMNPKYDGLDIQERTDLIFIILEVTEGIKVLMGDDVVTIDKFLADVKYSMLADSEKIIPGREEREEPYDFTNASLKHSEENYEILCQIKEEEFKRRLILFKDHCNTDGLTVYTKGESDDVVSVELDPAHLHGLGTFIFDYLLSIGYRRD